jgi:hypothetical protein
MVLAFSVQAQGPTAAPSDWTKLPPNQLLFHDGALKASYRDIEQMRPRELEALARIAACTSFALSKNEILVADCDRAADYFQITYSGRGLAITDLLRAVRLKWEIWRRHVGAVGDAGKEIERFVHIESNWAAVVRMRLATLDDDRR